MNKRYTLQFDFEGNIGPIKSAVEDLKRKLSTVKLPDNIGGGLEKTFGRLAAEFDSLEAIVKTGFDDLGNISKAEKGFAKINTLLNQLSIQTSQVIGIDPKKLLPQESLDRIKSLEKAWADVKKESEKKSELTKEIEKQTDEIEKQEKALKKLADRYDEYVAKNKALGAQKGIKTNAKNAAERRRSEVVAAMSVLEGQKGGKSSVEYKALSSEYSELSQTIKGLEADIRRINTEIDENRVEMAGLSTQIDQGTEAYKKMKAQLSNLKNIQITPKGLSELRLEIAKLTGVNIEQVPIDLEQLQNVINNLSEKELEEVAKALANIKNNSDSLSVPLENAKEGVRNLGEAGREVSRAAEEINNLKNQVLDFFSITNSIQLFKRAITSAMNTVKELDATMTEAAVVTDFSIGDMWEKLPEYSEEAQKLGVSINGMYQATTLYYQQGLKANEAMEVGVETMKMAKIAGMDNAQATEAMTAALRGFNMELDKTSATRVNDVYSQLAAVTAADTEQIATAMSKTASIAASANMEFESTAAFLAQIIETTQEAPETAGTALKTIIARFAEVKQLREQGLSAGEDEEGEIIDVNKIQTALRTVGISMEGFFAGTEGLDDVLLKLSEKWGSLDFETQRYIATMAAGSRQQSRFIAMMSDYGRTVELVDEAQNSAGASQKQFEKTQKSLETSLTRLKNAWDQFLMGLANNEVLKAGVDTLTLILENINKITDAISGGDGLVKSLTSLIGVVGALKLGKSVFDSQGFGSMLGGLTGQQIFQNGVEKKQNNEQQGSIPIKNPTQQGQKAGQLAGNGFVGSFARALEKGRTKGEKGFKKFTKNLFTIEVDNKQFETAFLGMEAATDSSLGKLQKRLREGEISTKEAAEEYKKLGGNLEHLGAEAVEVVPNIKAIGGAFMAAGTAAGLFSLAFNAIGWEEGAEIASDLASILTTVGAGISAIGSIGQAIVPILVKGGLSVTAAWGVIGVVILGVAAAIVGIIALINHEKSKSLEGRMQAAAEATERAKEAAEGAKQAYDDLLNDKSEYDTLQEKLDTLTKGTLEWKQALADSNAQVLKLLDTYPELAKYLIRGEHGELEITEEGWNTVQGRQEQAVKNASAAVVFSQIQETQLKSEKARENLSTAATKIGINGGVDSEHNWLNQNQVLEAAYQKYKEDPKTFAYPDSQELKELGIQINGSVEKLYELKDALAEYDQALSENEVTLQAQSEALLTNAASAETNAYEYGDEIIAGFAKGVTEGQKAKEDEIAKKLYNPDGKSESENNEYFQTLMKENGLTANDMTGDDAHDLEVLYAKMAGISREEIGDGLKGNKEKLAEEIAKMQAAKDKGQQIDAVAQKMQNLDKNTQKEYAAMISGKSDLMDLDIINKYLNENIDTKKIASDLGLSVEQLAEHLGVTTDELGGKLKEQASAANEMYADTVDRIKNLTRKDIPAAFNKASIGDLKSYAALLGQAMTVGSKETIEKGFSEIFAKVTDEQKQKIVEAMDTFSWEEEGAGEAFLEFLKTLGVEIEGVTTEGSDFANKIKLVNAAFRDFDIDNILDKVKQGLEEAEEVAGQDRLTNEQYKKYVASGMIENADEWSWDGKGWVNVTSGMDTLVQALKANVEATYGLTQVEAQKQLDWYNSKLGSLSVENDVFFDKNSGHILERGESPVENQQRKQAANAVRAGKATKQQWSLFFNSEDEYLRWVEMSKSDLSNLKTLANMDIDFKNIDISSDQEDYDKYYNTYEKLAAIARQRERLEKKRNKLLEDGNAEEAHLRREEIKQGLQEEKEKQKRIADGKKAEINQLLADNEKIKNLGGLRYNEDGTIQFDQDAVNAMGEPNREKFDELLSKLEELRDQREEAIDAEFDIDIQLKDITREDRDAYINFTTQIKDALLGERQKEIDELKEINDSINDANSKILDSMQQQIDAYRQARDNEKTEQDIEDKQRRLAYLQQDTSGANALEIMQLQKEIDEGQESYTDQLIDQKISELQQQNDEAAEQRERQIQIMEAQKEIWENGEIWDEIYTLMHSTNALNEDGSINENSELVKLLRKSAGYDSMSTEEKQAWDEEFKTNYGSSMSHEANNYGIEGWKTTFTTADGKILTGTYTADRNAQGEVIAGQGTVKTESGETYHVDNKSGSFKSEEEVKGADKEQSDKDGKEIKAWDLDEGMKPSKANVTLKKGGKKQTKAQVKGLQHALNLIQDAKLVEDGDFGELTEEAVKTFQGNHKNKDGKPLDKDGQVGPETRWAFKEFYKFETGGLADFTGPAWLDGTKTRPEYILNADQTKAFFQLVDVLSGLEHAPTSSTQNNGDINLDIDINVETINDTADLDMITQYVEDKIVSSANYRNNNVIGRSR